MHPVNKRNRKSSRLGDYLKRRRLPAPHAILYGGIVTVVFMACLCATTLYQERLDALARASEASRNVALIAERDIERNFEMYALSLQAVVDGVSQPEVLALPAHLRRAVLFDRAATARYLGALLVLDASGNIVIDARGDIPRKGNYADRKYFTVQRDNPNAGLYVSKPFVSRLRGGSPSIALSRRLSNPNGTFAGIAEFSVNLQYFHDLLAGLSLGPHGSVALLDRDGVVIMRQPYGPGVPGGDISRTSMFRRFESEKEESYSESVSIDGVRRLYTFQKLPDLPLNIMVAEAEQDVYATWWPRALTIGSLMGAISGGFVALTFLLRTQLRHRMRAESELELLARTDGLTGLFNRRTLSELLDGAWRRARRSGNVFSLLFLDIDRFKAYNDTYGHQAGDDALRAVAWCIGENIRTPIDSAARYGGEEFVVVLPDTSPAGASRIAERIRSAISELGIEHAGSEYGRITASIGTASWTPEQDGDVAAVIKAADGALYNAKASGRNKASPVLAHELS
ncbi:diguanylate cyclase (GGDEF)-like protein [Paraburkholderia sp. WSM4179]|nr:diguanylate cyclase (GGDEF)-like protein [Paraburkholderia sp. WSM4179]